ncbi:uncharacterized protein LOC144924169 [Branchiostoma floridae x Branchiostoma belcheri]
MVMTLSHVVSRGGIIGHVTRQLISDNLHFGLGQYARKVSTTSLVLTTWRKRQANFCCTLLREAACKASRQALEAGADIDFTQRDNDITGTGTALFIASYFGYAEVARLLIREGASLTKRTLIYSSAPLHGAVTHGSTEVVDLLVRHGATLDIRDGYQRTPLMLACMYNHVDTVRRLIQLGARVDLTDGHCHTAQRYCEMDMVEESCECERKEKMCDCAKDTKCDCARKETTKLIQEAMKTKMLRCCNPTCGKPGCRSTGTLKLCGQCKLTRYCSRDCQKQHWIVGHKKCCGHDAHPDQETPFVKALMAGALRLVLSRVDGEID